ncbi:MAG: carbonic anhydrase [Bacteroidales bacterium]|nr:carbonic anhydrase [Bacteroidales bacterium]
MSNTQELSKQVKSKESLNSITPNTAILMLKEGNKRFLNKEMHNRNHEHHIKETIEGQYPFAIIHSCIDSRVMPEVIFDQGIGDLFITRVAGNFINIDTLGSMEYACAVAGSKLIVILGHTACGAVKGACDDVKLGNLTSTLSHIKPAVDSISTDDGIDRSSKNIIFVNNVAKSNVEIAIENIKKQSPVLKVLYDNGKINIVGAMYNHTNGEVVFDK